MPGVHTRGYEFYLKILKQVDSELKINAKSVLTKIGEIETINRENSRSIETPVYSPDNEIQFKINFKKILKTLFKNIEFSKILDIQDEIFIKICLVAELEAGGINKAGNDLQQYELRENGPSMIEIPFILMDLNNDDRLLFKNRISINKQIQLNIVSTEKYGEFC